MYLNNLYNNNNNFNLPGKDKAVEEYQRRMQLQSILPQNGQQNTPVNDSELANNNGQEESAFKKVMSKGILGALGIGKFATMG